MSSNSQSGSPDSSSSDNTSSILKEIFISFIVLSSLFTVLYLVRWFLQRNTARRASFLHNCNTGGLDSASIAALPTFPYKRRGDNKNSGEEENNGSSMECSICLSTVEEGETVKFLPDCMHSFHADCVDLWLSGHTTCPVCRIQVLGSGSVVRRSNRNEIVVAV